MMASILRFLFPIKPEGAFEARLLLAARIVFGILLMSHGLAKWSHFGELSTTFPDPLGVGHRTSLVLAIFAEVFCSAGFVIGLFYRLALLPMIFTMCVAFFAVHGGAAFAERELAFVYLVLFVLMYVAGPGKYSLDRLFAEGVRTKGRHRIR